MVRPLALATATMTVELTNDTFLGLAKGECRYEDAAVVIVCAPYDGTTSYRAGAREGPRAIIAASQQVELWDIELEREIAEVGIATLPSIAVSAEGPHAVVEQVHEVCRRAQSDQRFVFTLGGEHSVTVGAARACAERFGDKLSFLQIDAHLDLRASYGGSPFSHACTGARLLEIGERLVHVGVRAACPEELEVITERGLDPLWAHEIAQQPREQWISRAIDQLGERVYVTVDVDGLDPSVFPATGTPMPGGLSWYDALALLRAVGEQREVVACDLVELCPNGASQASEFAAAQLAYKMIGYFVKAS